MLTNRRAFVTSMLAVLAACLLDAATVPAASAPMSIAQLALRVAGSLPGVRRFAPKLKEFHRATADLLRDVATAGEAFMSEGRSA